MYLTDEEMGITDDVCSEEGGTRSLTSIERSTFRHMFKTKLAEGLDSMAIDAFGRMRSCGASPTCIVVWKAPPVFGPNRAGNVQRAIVDSRKLIPQKIRSEAARHLNSLLAVIANVPYGVRKAITNYVFGGEVNLNSNMANKYSRFVENIAGGLPVDESLLVDGRKYNSCGGQGIGVTKFDKF